MITEDTLKEPYFAGHIRIDDEIEVAKLMVANEYGQCIVVRSKGITIETLPNLNEHELTRISRRDFLSEFQQKLHELHEIKVMV